MPHNGPYGEREPRHLLDLLNPEGPPTYLFEIAPEWPDEDETAAAGSTEPRDPKEN